MGSRIVRLPLPVEDAKVVAGWDATIEDDDADTSGSSTSQSTRSASRSLAAIAAGRSLRTSISKHALAHEHTVCGIASTGMETPPPNEQWIAWKTSLAPHRVCQVASNATGSLIAATLDNGTLSILRGTDGTVLATRRVAPEGTRLPASVEFVRSSQQRNNDSEADALMILPPEEGPPILVSNMQGDRLNSVDNPGVVAEAARSMALHALRLEGCDDIRAIRGLALRDSGTDEGGNKERVRLAVVDGDGKLAIYDYDLQTKEATLVERDVRLGKDHDDSNGGNNWEIDLEVELRVQNVPISDKEMASYLVFSLYMGCQTKICWLNLEDLTVACEYHIASPSGTDLGKRVRILAMEPIASCSPQSALALVLTIKVPADKPHVETRVIQAVVGDALEERAVKQPHLVYTIPVPFTVQSMSIAATEESPYSFLCKTWSGDNQYDCHRFTTDSAEVTVGSIRRLCATENFLEAQNALIQSQDESLVKDPFAKFHSSEITVKRLDSVLDAGSILTPHAMMTSQECLQQLVRGALSGNSLAQAAFMGVADRILNWPDDKALQNPPYLQEVATVLEGMITAMSSASIAFEGSNEYATRLVQLQERRQVVQYVQNLLQTNAAAPVAMTKAFAKVRTFKDLFATLVEFNYFAAAEKLARSNLRNKLTVESMASSVLAISPKVHPRLYSSLLLETIFPNLSISHELLPSILAWACKTADAFDADVENQSGLDDAIALLELAERATKDLRMRVHSSFSSYSPFVEKAGAKRRKVFVSKSNMDGSVLKDTSFASAASGQSFFEESESTSNTISSQEESGWERPNPTILEMGRLHGGAQKSRLGSQVYHMDAVDETEESVEFKLSSARCLKYARSLGLDQHLVTLGTFAKCGGAQYIAKELVRLFSATAPTQETRRDGMCNRLQPFCTSTGANFDEALISYARNLCGGKDTRKNAIEEAASVARCGTTAGTKCQVTLITLRAALFCRFSPPWLSDLSQEAIEWAAGDSSLRSELEEASRLLLIDGIVGRYCGEGAKELFHVDDPWHASRLVHFVAKHFQHVSVLENTLDLCDAFAHLSREEACSRILENAILEGDDKTAAKLLSALYERNILLARAVFSRVIAFCIELVEEAALPNSSQHKTKDGKEFSEAISCAVALTKIALSKIHSHAGVNAHGFSTINFDESALDDLFLKLMQLDTLMKDHSICLPISALCSPKEMVKTISNMLSPVVAAYLANKRNAVSTVVTQTKRACSLLSESSVLDSTDLWFAAVGSSACRLAMKSTSQECLRFMADLGVFEAAQNSMAARSCLAVSLSFCLKAAKLSSCQEHIRSAMKLIVTALSLIQDNAVMKCPSTLLDSTLSVMELCDVVTQVLVRADEGIGEELDEFRKTLQGQAAASNKPTHSSAKSLVRRPVLQSSWYVGDGLLLPPSETLSNALQYCKHALQNPAQSESVLNLHSFVDGRGAYSLALRLLSVAAASRMASKEEDPSYFGIQEAGKRTIVSLTERYVGGTSNGITSGTVDSQMAVSTLLCLPLKMAFSVYKSSLPTAISTRDFTRVVKLANVGIAAGSGTLFPISITQPLEHWARQRKFVAQCRELALRAKWWKILQECGIHFDTNRFQDPSQSSKEKTKTSSKYVLSLLLPFISSLSQRHSDHNVVLKYAVDFMEAFGLGRDVAVQHYVVYLLSPPKFASANTGIVKASEDIRLKLARLDSIVKSLLRQLESQVDRASVLRKCICRLEADNACDYERLAVVLSLYHAELSALLTKNHEEVTSSRQILELELIDRRRDALAILSWYFQGELRDDRPSFSKLFLPLPASWEDDYSSNMHRITQRILGPASSDEFDPLAPLERVLGSTKSVAAASALAPLCLPLGVPRGYIHARSLEARFNQSKEKGAALPSFEDDVLPVLNRLKQSADIAELSEWCSSQYAFEDEDKLRCLDHALNFAMKSSNESEVKQARRGAKDLPEDGVAKALDRVKRITAAKDLLADRLAINAILTSAGLKGDQSSSLGELVRLLMETLDETVWQKEEFSPEQFVETFISEASLVASEACLTPKKALSIGQLREFSVLVNRASTALADKYSHVQVSAIARRLVRIWLFYGDQRSSASDLAMAPESPGQRAVATAKEEENALLDIDEDDTMDFVMDLNALQQSSNSWERDFNPEPSYQQDQRLTSEDEPKAFRIDGSAREESDQCSRRASLRIAFVMAFTGESPPSNSSDTSLNDENEEPLQNSKVKPSRLRSKLSARGSKQRVDNVFEHSRELLRIVFAKSVSSGWIVHDSDTSFDSKSVVGSSSRNSKQTITFAMRHRALRVASILCPQDALEEVVEEEGFIVGSGSSLRKSAFAAFVAKEIEEMGLPLPHSDLAQLSTIHFPSYARTLWRHHRDDKRSKGRLLLLILEMYSREKISDHDFFLSVMAEMEKLNLPRTLLLAFECVCLYLNKIGPDLASSFIDKVGSNLSIVARSLAERITREMDLVDEDAHTDEIDAMVTTLRRFASVLQRLAKTADGQAALVGFADSVRAGIGKRAEPFQVELAGVLQGLLRHVNTDDGRTDPEQLLDDDNAAPTEGWNDLESLEPE